MACRGNGNAALCSPIATLLLPAHLHSMISPPSIACHRITPSPSTSFLPCLISGLHSITLSLHCSCFLLSSGAFRQAHTSIKWSSQGEWDQRILGPCPPVAPGCLICDLCMFPAYVQSVRCVFPWCPFATWLCAFAKRLEGKRPASPMIFTSPWLLQPQWALPNWR